MGDSHPFGTRRGTLMVGWALLRVFPPDRAGYRGGWRRVWCGSRFAATVEIDAIWSTYPIATAHMSGLLAARSGLCRIADFRDPMVQPDYPVDKEKRKRFL